MPNTKERLIELLETVVSPNEVLCDGEVLVSTARVADHLIANGVTVQEWISVKDRLPETQVEVLTYSECNGVRSACLLASDDETTMWYLCRTDKLSIAVTHWMPLPEPPKGE